MSYKRIPSGKKLLEGLDLNSIFVDLAGDSIIVHDLAGHILHFNEAAYKMRGYSRREFLSLRLHDLVPAEHREIVKKRIEQLHDQGRFQFESLNLKKDGTPLFLEVHGTLVENDGKKLIISIARDITKRKEAEEALLTAQSELEERVRERTRQALEQSTTLHSLFEQVPVGVALINKKLQFAHINAYAAATLSSNSEKLLNKAVSKALSVFGPEIAGEMLGIFNRTMKTGEPFSTRGWPQIKRKDRKKPVYLDWEIHRVDTPDGEPLGLLLTIVDVTQHVLNKEALIESEERSRSIGELIPFGVWVWVCDRHGRFSYISQSFLQMAGLTLEEIQESNLSGMLLPGTAPRINVLWKKCLREGIVWDCEFQILDKEGLCRTVLSRGVPLRNEKGIISSWVGLNLDITDRKQEEQLKETLNEINNALRSTLNVDDVLQKVLIQAAGAIGCESGCIMLRRDIGWACKAVFGLPRNLAGMELTDSDMPFDIYAVSTRKPAIIRDAINDSRFKNTFVVKYSIQSSVIAPLLSRSKVKGALFFNYNSKALSFTEAQVDFAAKLAVSISLALENARLHEKLIQQHKNLEQQVRERTKDLRKANEKLQREIAQHMQTQRALAESEERYRLLVELAPDPIGVISEGIVVFANKAGAKFFGVKRPDQIVGKNMLQLIHPDDLKISLVQLREIIKDGKVLPLTRKKLFKIDGTLMETEITAAPVNFKNKPAALVIARDITGRIQAEEGLRMSEERLAKVFNACPNPMAINALPDGRYLDINKTFEKFIGFSRLETIGRTPKELDIWVNPEAQDRAIEIILRDGILKNYEAKVRVKSGEECSGLFSAEIIELNGEQCLLTIMTDITDRKKIEKEVARLEQLNLVGEMAAGIGHEIRNPMTTVRGFLQLLGNKDEFRDSMEYFNLMIEELDRANAIITEFLSMAKNRTVDLKKQNINEIVEAIAPLIRADAMVSDKYLKLELGAVPELLLDAKEIRQLLLNLVRNGLEAMSPRGVLKITTATEKATVVLTVIDQGKGLDPGLMDKIGTPFFTTKDGGTGLGLAVCYSIASRHKAKIQVKSSPKGTTFSIRFPVNG